MASKKDVATWERILAFALSLPGAFEDHPWGETVVKASNKKIFVFLGMPESPELGIGVKLTDSHEHALSTPGAAPSGYGLGKAGWVGVKLNGLKADLLEDWIEESFRNVATKTAVKELDARS